MAELVLEVDGGLRRFPVEDGAVVGGGEGAAVRLADPTVGRQHATIGLGRRNVLRDLGGANASRVSGRKVHGEAAELADGAAVAFGMVTGWFFAGEVPGDVAAGKKPTCGVCQWEIEPVQDIRRCAACNAAYHPDCWADNGGCGTYGCKNAAGAGPAGGVADNGGGGGDMLDLEPAAPPPARMPWDSLLLVINLAAAVFGLLLFGVPALLSAGAALYKLRGRPAAVAGAVGIVGAAAGLAVSWFWWLAGPQF